MAVGSRLISLFTLSSLAVLICSFNASPVTALEISHNNNARSLHNRGHDALAKRKRSTKKSKRCRPKAAPPASSSKPADSKPEQPKPSQGNNKSGSGSGNSGSGGGNSSSGGGDSGGKHCLAWPNGDQWLDQWSNIGFMYDWTPVCPKGRPHTMQCCPMLWGWKQVQQWDDEMSKETPQCAMGMNEPEIPGQSNMSPESGVELWNKHIRHLGDKGVTLYSPATTSDPGGKKWMQTFFDKCGGNDKCGVDVLAVHWYDTTSAKLISYLEDLHDTFQLPLAVTEFACQNFNGGPQADLGQVWAFQKEATAFLESTPWIHKYCPFGAMQDMQGVNEDNKLMGGDGSMNALAKAYFGL